jgi:hypothetical protein
LFLTGLLLTHDLLRNLGNRAEINRCGEIEAVVCASRAARSLLEPENAALPCRNSAARVREGVEQWREAGITTPVLVPLSPDGNQMNGLKAVFAAFER